MKNKFNEYFLFQKLKESCNDFIPASLCNAGEYLFFIDEINSSIIRVSKDNKFNVYNSLNLRYPTNIVFDGEKYLYLTDRWNHRICKLDLDCNVILSFGKYGKEEGFLSEPWGIAYYDSHVYVVERNNHRVSVFDDEGSFKYYFGYGGPKKKYYESKEFKSGFVYDSWKNSSNKFNSIETNFFSSEYIIGLFYLPRNICIYNENIFVSDTSNNRIQIFDLKGKYKDTLELDCDYYPANINVINGKLYICSEQGDKMYLYDFEKLCLEHIDFKDISIVEIKEVNNKLLGIDCWKNKIFECLMSRA